VSQVGPGEWLVDGDLPVHEWAEAFRAQLPGLRFSTVGGLVVSLLGHIPAVGETAQYRNLQLTIETMRRRRVAMVRVRLVEKT
jgi:putative hemolysin